MALRRKPVRYERVLVVSLGVRGSTIPTTLLEFRCAPVGTGMALARKPAGIYWVEAKP